MITISVTGPKGDAPELANAIAHQIEQDGKKVHKCQNGYIPVALPEGIDVLLVICQEVA